MFLTRKEIRSHIEVIADELAQREVELIYGAVDDCIGELYALAEDIWPTCTEDKDEDSVREAVRETQYSCGN